MRGKLEKMLLYCDLIKHSQWKENNIRTSVYYNGGGKEYEQNNARKFQKKVTERLLNRIQTLKIEL